MKNNKDERGKKTGKKMRKKLTEGGKMKERQGLKNEKRLKKKKQSNIGKKEKRQNETEK
jgi:hypothetical protein